MKNTVSMTLIANMRNELDNYAKNLYETMISGAVQGDSALADGLASINTSSASVAPEVNVFTIREKYVEIFADDLKIGGMDRYMSKRIAKEVAERVLEDVQNSIEA